MAPQLAALAGVPESVVVADHDQRIARPRDEYVETLGSKHEPNVVIWIAPREARQHDVVLLALVVV